MDNALGMTRRRGTLRSLVVLVTVLAASMVVIAVASAPAGAAPENRSKRCSAVDDLGGSHGACVRDERPSEVCRSLESILAESGETYPYEMQIYVADENNVAVPATPIVTIDKLGACVGTFAPWQHEWVAIAL